MKYFLNTGFALSIFLGLIHSPDLKGQTMRERDMTIQELARNVEQNNIQLKLAGTSVKIAEARIEEAKTNRLPNLDASTKAMYLSDVSMYNPNWSKVTTVDIPNFGHQFNITANQLIFAGGKINKSIELAEMSKSMSEEQFRETDQGIKLNAAHLFINLYNLQNQKKILESNRVLAHERSKNSQLFLEQDMITKNEVLRAQVLERRLDQSILQIQNAIEVTNRNLTLLAGMDESVMIIPEVSNIHHEIRLEDEAYYREIAYQNNPQLHLSETQIAIAQKKLELTKTDRLPVLAGFAGYQGNRPQTSSSPAMDIYANSFQVGLNLSYNIASLYKNSQKEEVDMLIIQQAAEQKESVKQKIDADVNAAYKNYHQAIEQIAVSKINEEAAIENYRITELKYKNQLVTFIEMIDASNIKLQAELQTLEDETNIILNYVKLLRVTGQL